MDNLIRRQAAIEACGEMPEIWTDDDEFSRGMKFQWGMDTEAIKNLPSAELEIIRCKDCKHYKFSDNRAFGFPVKRCEWTGFEDVDDDDFCSRAERRTDETD